MNPRVIVSAAVLVACIATARGHDQSDVQAALARMEKTISDLSARLDVLEGKPQAKEEEDKPDEEATRKSLVALAAEQSGGVIEIVAFKKLDGLASVSDKVRRYAMRYETDVRFRRECVWRNMYGQVNEIRFEVAIQPPKKRNMEDLLWESQNPGVSVKRDAGFRITGIINFQKAESGWQIVTFRSETISEL